MVSLLRRAGMSLFEKENLTLLKQRQRWQEEARSLSSYTGFYIWAARGAPLYSTNRKKYQEIIDAVFLDVDARVAD